MATTIIALSGTARKVFRFLALIAQFNGEKTLKDLYGNDEYGRLQEIKEERK